MANDSLYIPSQLVVTNIDDVTRDVAKKFDELKLSVKIDKDKIKDEAEKELGYKFSPGTFKKEYNSVMKGKLRSYLSSVIGLRAMQNEPSTKFKSEQEIFDEQYHKYSRTQAVRKKYRDDNIDDILNERLRKYEESKLVQIEYNKRHPNSLVKQISLGIKNAWKSSGLTKKDFIPDVLYQYNPYQSNRKVEKIYKGDGTQAKGLFEYISGPFMDKVSKFIGEFTKNLKSDDVKANFKLIGKTILGILGKIALTIGKLIFDISAQFFKFSLKTVFLPAKSLLKTMGGILKQAANHSQIIRSIMNLTIIPFVLLFEYLLVPVIKVLAPAITTMVEFISQNKDAIMEWGEKLANFISSILEPIIGVLNESLFTNPAASVFDIMTSILDSANEYITNNKEKIGELLEGAMESAFKYIASSASLAANLMSVIVESLHKAITSDAFKEAYPIFIESFRKFMEIIREIMTYPEVKQLIKDMVFAFLGNFFDSLVTWIFGYGGTEEQYQEKISEDSKDIIRLSGAPRLMQDTFDNYNSKQETNTVNNVTYNSNYYSNMSNDVYDTGAIL